MSKGKLICSEIFSQPLAVFFIALYFLYLYFSKYGLTVINQILGRLILNEINRFLLLVVYSAKKYKYIIVDSDEESIKQLQRQLENYPHYTCCGIARSTEEAIYLIMDQIPHVVFFDPVLEVNGIKEFSFNMIPEVYQLLKILPHFIAMNKSNEYAYKAINSGVFAYILKPINHYELKKAIIRFENAQPHSVSICLKSFTEFRFLMVDDIVYLKADNNTTDFFLKDGTIVTSYQTLKTFESELPHIFTRIHKSYMVNVNYIKKIHFSKFQCSLRYTNTIIPFSKSLKFKMTEIKNLWSNSIHNGFPQQINLT